MQPKYHMYMLQSLTAAYCSTLLNNFNLVLIIDFMHVISATGFLLKVKSGSRFGVIFFLIFAISCKKNLRLNIIQTKYQI